MDILGGKPREIGDRLAVSDRHVGVEKRLQILGRFELPISRDPAHIVNRVRREVWRPEHFHRRRLVRKAVFPEAAVLVFLSRAAGARVVSSGFHGFRFSLFILVVVK